VQVQVWVVAHLLELKLALELTRPPANERAESSPHAPRSLSRAPPGGEDQRPPWTAG